MITRFIRITHSAARLFKESCLPLYRQMNCLSNITLLFSSFSSLSFVVHIFHIRNTCSGNRICFSLWAVRAVSMPISRESPTISNSRFAYIYLKSAAKIDAFSISPSHTFIHPYISKLSSLSRKSNIPIVVKPLSSRFNLISSFTPMIFLKESLVFKSDLFSWRSFASFGISNADWI